MLSKIKSADSIANLKHAFIAVVFKISYDLSKHLFFKTYSKFYCIYWINSNKLNENAPLVLGPHFLL